MYESDRRAVQETEEGFIVNVKLEKANRTMLAEQQNEKIRITEQNATTNLQTKTKNRNKCKKAIERHFRKCKKVFKMLNLRKRTGLTAEQQNVSK